MIPSALSLRRHYDKLPMPVAIMAGKGDKVVFARQARRLQAGIPGSTLRIIESVGHMLHHAAPQLVAEAVRQRAAPIQLRRRITDPCDGGPYGNARR